MLPKVISETDGDVLAAASSTDNALVRFDGTTGDLIQNNPTHTVSDIGETTFKTSTNSLDAMAFQNAASKKQFRIDTRDPAMLPTGSTYPIVTGMSPEGSPLTGSGVGVFSLNGDIRFNSGTQTAPSFGI